MTNVPLIRDANGAGTETKIGLHCTTNPRHGDFVVIATLTRVRADRGTGGCGTAAGYQRHHDHREPACPACIEAHQRHENPTQAVARGPLPWATKAIAARRQREELLSHA